MAKEHKGSIEGIDISNTCIRNMRSIHRESIKKGISFTYVHCILWREKNRSNVSYRVMDALHMHYPYDWMEMNDRNRKESFQCVFDKGTLDAINCGSFKNVVQLIREMEYDWLIDCDWFCSRVCCEGHIIIISQMSDDDRIQEFLSDVLMNDDACGLYRLF